MDDHLNRFFGRVEGLKLDATYKKRRSDLRDFNQWLDENGITALEAEPHHLDQYFIQLARAGYAPNTIGGRYDSV